jgi:hypothetical protein
MAPARWDRPLYLARRRLTQLWRNIRDVRAGTRPGSVFFRDDLRALLGCDDDWLLATAREYRACPAAWRLLCALRSPSSKTDGIALSLDVAEGFAAWALVKHVRPRVVLELGTLFGVSARLWKEALKAYVPGHELILVDIADERRFVMDGEARFVLRDGREAVPDICAAQPVDLLFIDAHPYDVVETAVRAARQHGVRALAFHDVGRGPRGLFRQSSASATRAERLRDDGPDFLTYGTWERHVMAETFSAKLLDEDRAESPTHTVQVFDSLFGFGVALRRT